MDVALELDVGNDAVLATDVEIDVNVCGGAWPVVPGGLLSSGEGGSSSSESELSDGDEAPTVEGLLSGESGLSRPSSSLPGPAAPKPASCRFERVANSLMGVGRRS